MSTSSDGHDQQSRSRTSAPLWWQQDALPVPVVLLLAVVLVVLLVLVGRLSEPSGGIGALRLPTATSEPTATATRAPTATATSAPTPLPAGYRPLPADVRTTSFGLRPDPTRSKMALRLPAGQAVQPNGEQQGERCRAVLFDDDGDDANNARLVGLVVP